jgi:hypothetical protein
MRPLLVSMKGGFAPPSARTCFRPPRSPRTVVLPRGASRTRTRTPSIPHNVDALSLSDWGAIWASRRIETAETRRSWSKVGTITERAICMISSRKGLDRYARKTIPRVGEERMSCERAVDAASFVHGGRKDGMCHYVSDGARKPRSPNSREVQLQRIYR